VLEAGGARLYPLHLNWLILGWEIVERITQPVGSSVALTPLLKAPLHAPTLGLMS
jgi:hypothetical protein